MRKFIALFVLICGLFCSGNGVSEMRGIGGTVEGWVSYLEFMLEAKETSVEVILVNNKDNNPFYEINMQVEAISYTFYMLIFTEKELVTSAYLICDFPELEAEQYDRIIDIIASTAVYISGMYEGEDSVTRERMLNGIRYIIYDMKYGSGFDWASFINNGYEITFKYSRSDDVKFSDSLMITVY